MIVRLQNLSARKPVLADLKAITSLLNTCDLVNSGSGNFHVTEEDILSRWQAPNFDLNYDAWVIVTRQGQLVAYAEVRHAETHNNLAASLYVHPDYRGRGIGTLLIWMVEERARYLALHMSRASRVSLRLSVNSFNEGTRHLLEREGYTHTYSFWRLMIDMQNVPQSSTDEFYQHGKFTVDMMVDDDLAISRALQQQRAGMYVGRQYDVYEKELRSAQEAVELQPSEEACLTC